MFIGHFGAGFAGKKISKLPSLGTLFMASQFIDLLWPVFLLLNIEHVKIDPGNTAFTPLDFVSYPFSHSLFAVIVWGALFAGIYYWVKKDLKSSLLLAALVLSHWILDFITHRPDLPLVPGIDLKVGLGLWNSVPFTILAEGFVFAAGIFLYIKTTKAINKKGIYTLWGLIAFLTVIYISNIIGPPPPGVEPIGYIGLSQWLIVVWGYWIDRNRKSSGP
ncbi:MAG: hypothetical protein H6627_09395 [Calditrichae bacterium]|nr:hypothetical protein [Calditrichota bacterium]MCB9058770.1 hypothetical protein [Calditrichia bacterium]